MAFSKAPTLDTYSSERVSLFREIALRDGGASDKDEDYLNFFMEPIKQSKAGDERRFLMKRAGTTQVVASVGASKIRGMHFWADQQKLLYCVGRNVYVYDIVATTSTTLTNVFATSTGDVGFCEYLYNTGQVKVLATDGSATSGLVAIDSSNVVTTNTDTDLPAHLPYLVFLDGYVFVVKQNTADIYNCDLDNPFSWSNAYISAEMEADLVLRIAKLNNYIIVFGKESVEYFWDAANSGTGVSPLQRNDSPIKITTYLAGFSIFGNTVYFIGADKSGQPDVYSLKDFKIESMGSASITRYLNLASDSIANWYGSIVSYQGHVFYVVNAGSSKTWAIDVETGLTHRIAFQQRTTFPIGICTVVFSTVNSRTYFALNDADSTIYRFSEVAWQDNGVNYTCSVTTEGNDFGTLNRKTMSRLSIIGDRPAADSNVTLYWSDDDYQTTEGGVSINMNQDLPCARRLGSFRQRVFKLTYTDQYPLRIQDIEVDINKGIS